MIDTKEVSAFAEPTLDQQMQSVLDEHLNLDSPSLGLKKSLAEVVGKGETVSGSRKMADNLDLNNLLAPYVYSGAGLTKCCHYFHSDCLNTYLTTTKTQKTNE